MIVHSDHDQCLDHHVPCDLYHDQQHLDHDHVPCLSRDQYLGRDLGRDPDLYHHDLYLYRNLYNGVKNALWIDFLIFFVCVAHVLESGLDCNNNKKI